MAEKLPIAAECLALVDRRTVAESDPQRLLRWRLLRERLVGELLGDVALIESGTAEDFELVSALAGSPPMTLDRGRFLAIMQSSASAGAMSWLQWDHLALDGDVLMGDGRLYSASGHDGAVATVTVTPLVIVLEYAADKISREFVSMDTSQVTRHESEHVPTRDELVAQMEVR